MIFKYTLSFLWALAFGVFSNRFFSSQLLLSQFHNVFLKKLLSILILYITSPRTPWNYSHSHHPNGIVEEMRWFGFLWLLSMSRILIFLASFLMFLVLRLWEPNDLIIISFFHLKQSSDILCLNLDYSGYSVNEKFKKSLREWEGKNN